MKRRQFLEMLGLAGSAVAFNAAVPGIWELPRHLIMQDGPVTGEWIAAESLKVLCEHYDFSTKKTPGAIIPIDQLQQLGVSMTADDSNFELPRDSYRKLWIEPAMTSLANELTARKVNYFLPMETPHGINDVHLITHRPSGLNLRYIKAYDMGHQWTDESGKECFTPPHNLIRMDVRCAT